MRRLNTAHPASDGADTCSMCGAKQQVGVGAVLSAIQSVSSLASVEAKILRIAGGFRNANIFP